jgi:hypothetical protein
LFGIYFGKIIAIDMDKEGEEEDIFTAEYDDGDRDWYVLI